MTFTIETIFAYEDVRVEGVFVCLLREFIDGRCIDSYVDGWRKRYVVESFESIFACATSYEDKNDSDTLFIRNDDETTIYAKFTYYTISIENISFISSSHSKYGFNALN